MQSAYRAIHSTETTLLKIQKNDSVIVIVMLNLFAAFDTIDHVFFISHLSEMYYYIVLLYSLLGSTLKNLCCS